MENISIAARIEEIDNKINELSSQIQRLKDERHDLERLNKQYFVGHFSNDDGRDYWDEYFCPIGYTTEAEAKAWIEKRDNGDSRVAPRYLSLTKEEYNDLVLCAKINEAKRVLGYSQIDCKVFHILMDEYDEHIKRIPIIKYPSFQHICLKYDG